MCDAIGSFQPGQVSICTASVQARNIGTSIDSNSNLTLNSHYRIFSSSSECISSRSSMALFMAMNSSAD